MAQVKINGTINNNIVRSSLQVKKQKTNKRNSAKFQIRSYGSRTYVPQFDDDVEIFDTGTKIFGGKIMSVSEKPLSGGGGLVYDIDCVDHQFEMDKQLVARSYENKTIKQIIDDIISSYVPGFTTNNVSSNFEIEKIVFNQKHPSECIQKLADIVRNDWYVDVNKDLHFFGKGDKTAPYDLTDTSGNYVYNSLERSLDGSQVVNRVKVRGGKYDADTYTDTFTVNGNDTKSFNLPYKMSNVVVELSTDGGSTWTEQSVGVDFINDFSNYDVLHNYQDQNIKFENALSDGDKLRISGNPKVRVLAVGIDTESRAKYGEIEKILRDNDIESNAIARKRANAELLKYAEQAVDAKFKTYDKGLEVGQVINLDSTLRGNNDDLIINSITYQLHDSENFVYQVECVDSSRMEFIDFMRRAIGEEEQDPDESEVSEEIFADKDEVIIQETHEVIAPKEDIDSITIVEDHYLNPIDPANIQWVYGYYHPSSNTDTKRMAKFDRDSKFQ